MANEQTSLEIASLAELKRAELKRTLDQLSDNLQPQHLREEAGGYARGAAESVSHKVVATAQAHAGLIAAGAGALSLALYGRFANRRSSKGTDLAPSTTAPIANNGAALALEATPSPAATDANNVAKAKAPAPTSLLVLAASIGLGVALNKLLPPNDAEKSLVGGAGEEIKSALRRGFDQQLKSLVAPAANQSFGAANIAAALIGVAAAAMSNRANGAKSGPANPI